MNRLAVCVLGHRNAGKTFTWKTLFGKSVKTGGAERPLDLGDGEVVDVFLVSGSSEERVLPIGSILGRKRPSIVLCSIQYVEAGFDTLNFFANEGYERYVQWLNPGRTDPGAYPDNLGLVQSLLWGDTLIGVRDGKVAANRRVRELREHIRGWAKGRKLIRQK